MADRGEPGRSWRRSEVGLPDDHGWTARPGCQIVVADRGAVRFDIPAAWSIEPRDDGSLRLRDRTPPDDDCGLDVSILRLPLPPGAGPPPDELLRSIGSGVDPLWRSEPHTAPRGGADCAWTETRYVDEETGREAWSYSCIARGGGVHAVLTMSLWVDDVDWVRPIWDVVLETLEVGAEYDVSGRDPRRN